MRTGGESVREGMVRTVAGWWLKQMRLHKYFAFLACHVPARVWLGKGRHCTKTGRSAQQIKKQRTFPIRTGKASISPEEGNFPVEKSRGIGDFPIFFTEHHYLLTVSSIWQKRKCGIPSIGKLVKCSSPTGERFEHQSVDASPK